MDPLFVLGAAVLVIVAGYFLYLDFFSKPIVTLTEAVVAVQSGGFSQDRTQTDDPDQPGTFGNYVSRTANLIYTNKEGVETVRVTLVRRHGAVIAVYKNGRFHTCTVNQRVLVPSESSTIMLVRALHVAARKIALPLPAEQPTKE